MRCSHCSSGRMKRAENFGAERLQCGSCGVVTKQAHHSLTGKQQEFINYVGMWSMERIENAWEVTQDLDQNGIGMAIGISRSNVPRLVEPLITAGLVRKKKAHILDENNRVKSHKKWVYYLTPEGRKHVTESRRAESFEADSKCDRLWDCKTCERCKSHCGCGNYKKLRRTNMRKMYGKNIFTPDTRCGFDAESFGAETIKTGVICGDNGCSGELLETEYGKASKVHCNKCDYSEIMEWDAETFEAEEPFICPQCRRASTKSKTSQVCVRCESEYQSGLNPPMRVPWPGDDGYYAETFEASRSDLRRRRRTPFYKIERTDEDEDHDQNRYARTNAGGALWEATYQALRDEGRSHAQAEAFCNSKFFDHYYEAIIEGLRRPMRKVLKDIRRANRKAGRDFDKKYLIDEFIFDDKVFNAHEGGHIDDSFEAPNRYPVRPTRPSEDWPRPTPRPRRPNRRPNPRPRPARRPF